MNKECLCEVSEIVSETMADGRVIVYCVNCGHIYEEYIPQED